MDRLDKFYFTYGIQMSKPKITVNTWPTGETETQKAHRVTIARELAKKNINEAAEKLNEMCKIAQEMGITSYIHIEYFKGNPRDNNIFIETNSDTDKL